MKKLLTVFYIFSILTFGVYSQVIDYTGTMNPYTKLTQEEKDAMLLKVCQSCYRNNSSLKKLISQARFLLQCGANPNQIDSKQSLLYIATDNDCFDLMKELIEAGADVNFVYSGYSIVYAMISSYITPEQLEYVLQKGANPNAPKGEENASPLIKAARYGYIDHAKMLIKYGADIHAKTYTEGRTLLAAAACTDNMEFVKYCVSLGCKPSDSGKDGIPPVYEAIRHGSIDIAKYLIEKGDNINRLYKTRPDSKYSATPLERLIYSLNYSSEDYLTHSPKEADILLNAVKLGADPFITDTEGENAIDAATYVLGNANRRELILKMSMVKFLTEFRNYIPNSEKHKKQLIEYFIKGDTEEIKKNIKSIKSEKSAFRIYTVALSINPPNLEENIEFLLDSGIKPRYESIFEALRRNQTDKAKKYIKYADLKKGDGVYKYDFVAYCKNHYFFNSSDEDLKDFIPLMLDAGFTYETLIYDKDNPDGIPFLLYLIKYDESYDNTLLKALLDKGADPNYKYKGQVPLNLTNYDSKKYNLLLDYGAEK